MLTVPFEIDSFKSPKAKPALGFNSYFNEITGDVISSDYQHTKIKCYMTALWSAGGILRQIAGPSFVPCPWLVLGQAWLPVGGLCMWLGGTTGKVAGTLLKNTCPRPTPGSSWRQWVPCAVDWVSVFWPSVILCKTSNPGATLIQCLILWYK